MAGQFAKGIKPTPINSKRAANRLLKLLEKESKFVKSEFEKTTRTWKAEKPTFKIQIKNETGDLVANIFAAGDSEGVQKWIWLDEGTKPHPIAARNVPNLVFRTKFSSKTKVKTFGSSAGSIAPPWRSTPSVRHPGIEARDWTGEMVKIENKKFPQGAIKAVKL